MVQLDTEEDEVLSRLQHLAQGNCAALATSANTHGTSRGVDCQRVRPRGTNVRGSGAATASARTVTAAAAATGTTSSATVLDVNRLNVAISRALGGAVP